jgi:hypothetical protein
VPSTVPPADAGPRFGRSGLTRATKVLSTVPLSTNIERSPGRGSGNRYKSPSSLSAIQDFTQSSSAILSKPGRRSRTPENLDSSTSVTLGETVPTSVSGSVFASRTGPSSSSVGTPTGRYVVVSPYSCPPSQPTGSLVGGSDATFSAQNGGLQVQEYPNSQFIIQDSDDGPFFIDLSSPDEVAISDNDGDTIVFHVDGTFEAFAGFCDVMIAGSWQSVNAKSRARAKRQILNGLCIDGHSVCDSYPLLKMVITSAAETLLCDSLGAGISTNIGTGIAFIGNLFGPAVGLPATLVGAQLGRKLGPWLCDKALDLVADKLCEAASCSSSTTSLTTTIESSITTLTTTTTATSTTSTTSSDTATATYVPATDDCSTGEGLGTSVFCCSGSCADGSSIGVPGLCENWDNLCLDLAGGPPSCSSDQVLKPGSATWIDSGDGNCWGGNECQWQRNDWAWTCCDCPPGFISTTGGDCDPGGGVEAEGPPLYPCVGCTSGEVLAGDATGGYYCIISTEA